MKTCSKCQVVKSASDFAKQKMGAQGLRAACRQCEAERDRHYRAANRDEMVARQKAGREANPEKARAACRDWSARNPERKAAAIAKWYASNAEMLRERASQRRAANPGMVREQQARKRAALSRRTPPWADLEAIKAVYEKAARIAQLTGEPVHVDHDIPLRGKLVSGLHVHTNLVIRHAVENLRKSNRFEIA